MLVMFFLECEEYPRLHAPPSLIFLSPNNISNIPQKWPILKEPTPCHRNHISSRVKKHKLHLEYERDLFSQRIQLSSRIF